MAKGAHGGGGGGGRTHFHNIIGDGVSTTLNGTKRADQITGADLGEIINGNERDDLIYANGGNDTVAGGAGNDRMDGGSGTDTAVFSGAFSSYSFSLVANSIPNTTPSDALQVVGPDGTDLLVNFELLDIGGVTYDVATIFNQAPTGIPDTTRTSVDENVAAGVQVADLNATDADLGDAISYYFKDLSGVHVQTTLDGNFSIDATTGVVTTLNAFPNYEIDAASRSFTAFAGDSHGAEDSGLYTVQVRNVAETDVVDFNDFYGIYFGNVPLPDGYDGFNWFGNSPADISGGFPFVAGSGGGVAWNNNTGVDSWFTRADGTNFDLMSLDFASFGTEIQQVQLIAYDKSHNQMFDDVIDVNGSQTLTKTELNWENVSEVHVLVTEGTGTWVMDNIVFREHFGVDFEGTLKDTAIPDGYGGLNWASSGGAFGTPDIYGGNPIRGAAQIFNIAPDNEIAWNAGAGQHTVISRDTNFDLKSLDLVSDTLANFQANRVHITASDDGTQKYETFIDLTQNLTTTTFNWTGIDTINFDVVAGSLLTADSLIPTGFWGMDNLILT
jgi:hypothetical protein